MFVLKDLLSRYRGITLPDELVRREAVTVIKDLTGLDLTIKQVQVKNYDLVIAVPAIVKSAIYVKREKIIAALTAKLGQKAPRKVK